MLISIQTLGYCSPLWPSFFLVCRTVTSLVFHHESLIVLWGHGLGFATRDPIVPSRLKFSIDIGLFDQMTLKKVTSLS